jgi:hypothetical protein
MSEKSPTEQARPILEDWAKEERVMIEWFHEWRKPPPSTRCDEQQEYVANGLMTGPAERGELPLGKCFEHSLRNHVYQAVTAFGYDAAGHPKHNTVLWPIVGPEELIGDAS